MGVLVIVETDNTGVRNTSLESVTLAAKIAEEQGTDLNTIVIGTGETASIGGYSFSSAANVSNENISDSELADLIQDSGNHNLIILPSSGRNDAVAAKLGVRLNASVVTSVVSVKSNSPFVVTKGVYTGKAFADFELSKDVKILTTKKNSFDAVSKEGSLSLSELTVSSDSKIEVLEEEKLSGGVLLPEADLVVSAGRGLKGPENWGMIEELAEILGAATGCSKPVSDVGWRPHHEHVGQTGIKVSPNLYIAIGISGAIQHLAGVSSSKVIVAINTDEEAPLFKAANYGIVGDAFQVVPKLIEVLKNQ